MMLGPSLPEASSLSPLWLLPSVPLLGAVINLFSGRRLGRSAGWIASTSVGAAFVLSLWLVIALLERSAESRVHIQHLFDWMNLHKRNFFPREFEAVSMRPWDNFFWWIETAKPLAATQVPGVGAEQVTDVGLVDESGALVQDGETKPIRRGGEIAGVRGAHAIAPRRARVHRVT